MTDVLTTIAIVCAGAGLAWAACAAVWLWRHGIRGGNRHLWQRVDSLQSRLEIAELTLDQWDQWLRNGTIKNRAPMKPRDVAATSPANATGATVVPLRPSAGLVAPPKSDEVARE